MDPSLALFLQVFIWAPLPLGYLPLPVPSPPPDLFRRECTLSCALGAPSGMPAWHTVISAGGSAPGFDSPFSKCRSVLNPGFFHTA